MKRRPPTALLALLAVSALAGVAVLTGVIELPDVGGRLEDLTATLGAWTYLLVPGLAFLETGAFVGLIVPGETAVLLGGVVAERGDVTLVPLIALVWLAAVAGDVVSFLTGRRLGRRFLERHGHRLGIREAQLARAERFFARYGGRAVLLGRFIGVLRALTPFVAGASGYPLRRFLPFSVAGTLAWATTFTLIGARFSQSLKSTGATVTFVLLAAALLGAAASLLVARAKPRISSPRRSQVPPHGRRHDESAPTP